MQPRTTVTAAFVTATILTALAGQARAADPGNGQQQTPRTPLVQESIGLEATPVAYALSGNSGGVLGVGGSIRLARHRWPTRYWTPLTIAYFGGGTRLEDFLLGHLMTEVGLVTRSGPVAFEAGLGVGGGLLAINLQSDRFCDGACRAGGLGLFASPVVRVLFRETAPCTLGAVLRLELPVVTPHVEGFVGYGAMALLGLDVGCALGDPW